MQSILKRSVAAASMIFAFGAPGAFADRAISGAEAHQMLAGQTFEFVCVDGTRGHATYAHSGVATASYRLPTAGADAAVQKDQGRVRANGESLCIRWNKLGGGTEGCYRMTERRPGVYRIADGQIRWCDLKPHGSRAASN